MISYDKWICPSDRFLVKETECNIIESHWRAAFNVVLLIRMYRRFDFTVILRPLENQKQYTRQIYTDNVGQHFETPYTFFNYVQLQLELTILTVSTLKWRKVGHLECIRNHFYQIH